MNISSALLSSDNILLLLKKQIEHPRCPPIEEVHSKRELDEAHGETLRKCMPFIQKIVKEAKVYIQNFNEEKSFENVISRRNYVEAQLLNAKESFKDQEEKNKIISQIENLEKTSLQKYEKIVIDEANSIQIIDFLFENCEDCFGLPVLSNFIELTFDRTAGDKTESYEKILQSICD